MSDFIPKIKDIRQTHGFRPVVARRRSDGGWLLMDALRPENATRIEPYATLVAMKHDWVLLFGERGLDELGEYVVVRRPGRAAR